MAICLDGGFLESILEPHHDSRIVHRVDIADIHQANCVEHGWVCGFHDKARRRWHSLATASETILWVTKRYAFTELAAKHPFESVAAFSDFVNHAERINLALGYVNMNRQG